jgi:hypothetical protein
MNDLQEQVNGLSEKIGTLPDNFHTHNGINSKKVAVKDVIKSFIFTTTQLNNYLASNTTNGDEFNYYNSDISEYGKYFRLNKIWTKVGVPDLSGYVPTSRTVNGHALSSNISLTTDDISGLGSVASDNLKDDLSTERSNTLYYSYTSKQVRINRAGTVRVSFAIHSNTNYSAWSCHLRLNGNTIQTIQNTATPYVYTTYTYDVSVGISDTIDVTTDAYTGNCTFYIKDFKVFYDYTTLTDNILIN